MANLRILYDNVADSATLSAATTASASFSVSNALTDLKSQPYRSVGTTAVITVDWSSARSVQAVILPCTNLTSAATMRVQGYNGATLSYDVTAAAVPGDLSRPWGWEASAPNVNSYGFGGGSGARHWLPFAHSFTRIVITLADSSNPAGYVEVSRVMAGTYWEATKNADYGASLSMKDSTVQSRNDAGDLVTDLGTKSRGQTLALSNLGPADRTALWRIIDTNGSARPIFLSLYPADTDGNLEQDNMMWCRLAPSLAINTPSFRNYASSLEFLEM